MGLRLTVNNIKDVLTPPETTLKDTNSVGFSDVLIGDWIHISTPENRPVFGQVVRISNTQFVVHEFNYGNGYWFGRVSKKSPDGKLYEYRVVKASRKVVGRGDSYRFWTAEYYTTDVRERVFKKLGEDIGKQLNTRAGSMLRSFVEIAKRDGKLIELMSLILEDPSLGDMVDSDDDLHRQSIFFSRALDLRVQYLEYIDS